MGGSREGSDFQNLHRNKRSMVLNLKDPDGVAIVRKMAETADVVVENYRPDVKFRLGIDYETLSAANPRLVYASISGFGQDGPLAGRPGFDQIAQGMGGLMSITGAPGEGPMRVGIPIADLTAGGFAAQGVLLALLGREKTGKGQWVQTSLLQAQIAMLDFQAARWLMDGNVPKQAGNDHPTSIPTGVFATSDGFINIACAGQHIWLRLKEELADERMDHEDYADQPSRSENRKPLNAIINENTSQNSTVLLGRALCRNRRALWRDQQHPAGVRKPAGAASGHGPRCGQPGTRSGTDRRSADQDEQLVIRHPQAAADQRPAHRRNPRRVRLYRGGNRRLCSKRRNMKFDQLTAHAEGKLLTGIVDRVGHVVINNPERHNAISLAMYQAGAAEVNRMAADPEARLLVVRGAGGQSLCVRCGHLEIRERTVERRGCEQIFRSQQGLL
ncbi:MAG: hypothetical protein CM15mP115_16290 [Alphaproteobacteria bacterium]|nr:MAG: hypothetical protein CM15mP115_16290 [Alphaproteobacteria bacterium]